MVQNQFFFQVSFVLNQGKEIGEAALSAYPKDWTKQTLNSQIHKLEIKSETKTCPGQVHNLPWVYKPL